MIVPIRLDRLLAWGHTFCHSLYILNGLHDVLKNGRGTLNKKLRLIGSIGVVILFTIALSVSKYVQPAKPVPLSVQVEQAQVGSHIVAQNPIAGQRLDLSPVIQVTFDRDMDRGKTAQAFSLNGPDGRVVPGSTDWSDARTLESVSYTHLTLPTILRV